VKRIAIALADSHDGADFASAAVEGAILGDYEPDRHKTGDDKESPEAVAIVGGQEADVERGRILAEAPNFTRVMANEPANLMTPLKIAEEARNMAAAFQ
jgi:leucyl aminopeptidase